MLHSLPALFLGLIVGLYWARVLKMVLKQRRKTGRDANLVPREKLGLILRIIWYPAVILWILIPFLIAFTTIRTAGLAPIFYSSAVSWIGAVVSFISLALTWICWKKMGKSWRMGIDPNEKTQLVVSGPYAYVRHPIYGLQIILALSSMLVVPAPAMIAVCGIIIIFLSWEARREEKYLLSVHGEIYGAFMQRVGGFFPRSFSPYHPAPPSV